MRYQPKCSSLRWLKGAPRYVLACYDNGGKTADRYTVIFGGPLWTPEMGRSVPFLGMSDAPTHPQGFSQWGEMPAYNRAACGRKVKWRDLPGNIRRHVRARCK